MFPAIAICLGFLLLAMRCKCYFIRRTNVRVFKTICK
jgi:hypothetical protein